MRFFFLVNMGDFDLQFTLEDIIRFFEEAKLDEYKTISLAHHIIPPLQGILGVTDDLSKHPLFSHEQRLYLNKVHNVSKKLGHSSHGVIALVSDWSHEPSSFEEYYDSLCNFVECYPALQVMQELKPLTPDQEASVRRLDNLARIQVYSVNQVFSPNFKQDFFFLTHQYEFFITLFDDMFRESRIYLSKLGVESIVKTKVDYFTSVVTPLIWNIYHHALNSENDIFNRKHEKFWCLVELITEAEPGETESGNYLVTLRDNGFGMQPEVAKHIFEKGFSTKSKDTIEHGIGLWSVKRFVEEQGGRIWFETELGKGTSFHFTIPYSRKEDFLYIQ